MAEPNQPYIILAALQFDETGDRALREAVAQMARHQESVLHLVHVGAERELSQAPQEIEQRLQNVRASEAIAVTAHIRSGNAAHAILQTASDIDADVLVLGTHQRVGLERLVVGSVAERVLRGARCPVLIAAPKDYGAREATAIEPPCDACLLLRQATQGRDYWCERHGRAHLRLHVYKPSDPPRASGAIAP